MLDALQYAEGVSLAQVEISGWQAWMLLDTAANGDRRAIALLDEEALRRISEQAQRALELIQRDRQEESPADKSTSEL